MISKVKQAGVSLLEILITVLVLGIGLLGVAALQVSSVASNQEGFFTTQATSIGEDFASRIRNAKMASAISDMTLDGVLTAYDVEGAFDCANPPTMCRVDGNSAAQSCTLAQLAAFDRWDVCRAAEETLPQGQVRVERSGIRMTIVVDWNSAAGNSTTGIKKSINTACTGINNNADRNCVILEVVP
ncbi:type IV pilus modification protein PilV [Aliikangiella sp. G2MR2-5]|uniref:type IV pilus modification protein PilV n=1 Tax=Aliikangiella sp. G2MR2-5 TaxID=2788943 RepID=UPI0018ABFEAB|nr:type IV pilus modification protein PilV [Aliikangiella sp. G2MR2-5]